MSNGKAAKQTTNVEVEAGKDTENAKADTKANDTKPDSAPDPFDDLENLRLDQSFADQVGVKKLITTIPVRKPNRQDFVRVHPDPAYRLTPAALLELKEDRETYFVLPEIAQELPDEFYPATLYTTINTQRVLTLWQVKLPGERVNEWHRSAAEAAEMAMGRWIRVRANMAMGAYEISEAMGNLSEPTWPDLSFREIMRIAFRDRMINSFDHPVIRRLRGL
jgi:hypothetical protein